MSAVHPLLLDRDAPTHVIDGAFVPSLGFANDAGDAEYRYIDPVTGRPIAIRRRLRRYLRLNLLDHKGIIARKAPAVGASVGTMIQGVIMSGVMGMILSLLGATSIGVTLLAKAKTALAPVIDMTEKWLDFGKEFGLPVEEFQRKVAGEMVAHYLPQRCLKYAVFTLFGRGGGSFWLGMLSAGITAAYAPDAMHQMVGMVNSSLLLKQGLELSASEIANYRFLHHPEILAQRLREVVTAYRNLQLYRSGKSAEEVEKEIAANKAKQAQNLKEHTSTSAFLMDNAMAILGKQETRDASRSSNIIEEKIAGEWMKSEAFRARLEATARAVDPLHRLEVALTKGLQHRMETVMKPSDVARDLAKEAMQVKDQVKDIAPDPFNMRSMMEAFALAVYPHGNEVEG